MNLQRFLFLLILGAGALAGRTQSPMAPRPSKIEEPSDADLQALNQHRFVGDWELLSISPKPLADTDPRGIPSVKVVLKEDGRFTALKHDERLSPDTQYLAWETTPKRLKFLTGKGKIQWCIPRFEGSLRMSLTMIYPSLGETGATFTYGRITDPRGADTEVEKRSLQIVQGGEPWENLAPVIPAEDAALPLNQRLQGVWEVIAVAPRNTSTHQRPPFGFFNDLWMFGPADLTVSVRQANAITRLSWSLAKEILTTVTDKGLRTEWALRMDTWGHLILETSDLRMELKHLTREASTLPKVPMKVVLLER